MNEKIVKARIKKLLDSFKPDVWYFMPFMSGMGRAGIPDFIINCNGKFIAVEAKASPDRQPTVVQQRELSAILQAGGTSLVIHSDNIKDLSDTLRGILGLERVEDEQCEY